MKKKGLVFLFVFFVGTLFWAFSAEKGRIVEIHGKVEVKQPGGDWEPAKAGVDLTEGTLVSTGFGSWAKISIVNAELQIEALSRLTLAEMIKQQDVLKTDLRLRVGRIRVEIKKDPNLKNDFTLKTPTSTAAVRGTVFTFDGENLSVIEGAVSLANRNGRERRYSAGQKGRIPPGGGSPVPPAAVVEASSTVKPASGNAEPRTAPKDDQVPRDVFNPPGSTPGTGTFIISW